MTTMTKKLPKNPLRQDIMEILGTLEEFSAVLKKETAALRKLDFKTVDTLQDGKRDVAKRYQGMVNALVARSEEMAALEKPLRERLVKARTGFTLLLGENMRALEAVKDSSQRLVNKILDAARQAVTDENQTNYSARGKAQAYKTSTLSFSIDTTL